MVHCVSEDCRQELDEKWSFCPYCGTDNRPPEDRTGVDDCVHEFFDSRGFCVLCGEAFSKSRSNDWGRRPESYAYDNTDGSEDVAGCLWGLAGRRNGCWILPAFCLLIFSVVRWIMKTV